MRIFMLAATAAAATLLAQPAQAVTSKVSGKYAFQEIDLCEAKLGATTTTVLAPGNPNPTTKNVIQTLTMPQAGLMATAIGYITFTPKTTTSGDFSLSSTMIEGGAL